MKTEYNIGVTLSAEEVESILKEHIRATTGLNVTTCKINMKAIQKGDQRDSWTETVFSGATLGGVAKTHKDMYTGGTNSLAAQIAAVESDPRQYGNH